jgi:hypothetical protein
LIYDYLTPDQPWEASYCTAAIPLLGRSAETPDTSRRSKGTMNWVQTLRSILNTKRDELAPPRHCVVNNAEKRSLAATVVRW